MLPVLWQRVKARRDPAWHFSTSGWFLLLAVYCWTTFVGCMSGDEFIGLRRSTVELFYHGFDGYMKYAYPEDELRPVSCSPLSRDRENAAHIELNDVLGNYSLTLVDSLSTLAILASSSKESLDGRHPLKDFQNGVVDLVRLYGDGTHGLSGQGLRSTGFALDSKVQVFETVIRGVGGLLSAHLFAEGHLPIRGYQPNALRGENRSKGIKWRDDFVYDGQLLRLASDLANRLLPAFYTPTGLPYPRVNLRSGVPFYDNSPLNQDAENGQCQSKVSEAREITETCSAGAGSLVLEFTVLSRLTGDARYERAAKRAFEAVWDRKSSVGLIGAGIDAETGQWVSPFTGIGAGVDSFFEYAMKSHILLSRTKSSPDDTSFGTSEDFLAVWKEAHAGIKRHLYRDAMFQHPHYIQGDLFTGASRAYWIDSLSAYYPGLLTLSGELEEAIETHLLFAALWTRYSALPERWNVASGDIDNGLRWWGGRPEFIESTWYLYRATKDPWYLHVGEMTLHDIVRRCRTPCGWAGLEDVRTGELKDRMESFFLGETAKYLFLLFEPSHPMNHLDEAMVFTTEGHPLLIPRSPRHRKPSFTGVERVVDHETLTCPVPSAIPPFGMSAVVGRPDFFHAAALARLHLMSVSGASPDLVVESSHNHNASSVKSSNYWTSYPWTLPSNFAPVDSISSRMDNRKTFDLSFPTIQNAPHGPLALVRTPQGLVINSVSGLKLSMVQEKQKIFDEESQATVTNVYRIHTASHLTLGRDEQIFISPSAYNYLNVVDPYLTRHRDIAMLDMIVEPNEPMTPSQADTSDKDVRETASNISSQRDNATFIQNLLQQVTARFGQGSSIEALLESIHTQLNSDQLARDVMPASAATGIGSSPLPDVADALISDPRPLTWHSIYHAGYACDSRLPVYAPKKHQVIVMKRGGCSFSEKLRNIPTFAPSHTSLQLVVIVSDPELEHDHGMVRPLLDEIQHGYNGIVRRHPIAMVMVDGGERSLKMLENANSVGIRRRYHFTSQETRIVNMHMA